MELDTRSVKKILIINLAFIGDVVLSTPVARALRQKWPEAIIDMLVVPLTVPIAKGNPFVDHVIEYDKRGRHKKIGNLIGLVREIRAQRYDLAIATNHASRGAILAWVSGIRYRVGYDAQHAGIFLTHIASAKRTEIRHEAENYLDVLKPLGIRTEDTSLTFRVDPEDVASMWEKVTPVPEKPIVVICPIGSYPLKSWRFDGYAELIRRLAPVAACYLIGGRGEQRQLEEINASSGSLAGVLAGTLTLGEVAALIEKAKLLVTVDTGPMHIANAVGTPAVALFGPTDPKGWGPRGASDIVLQHPVNCSPCWGKRPCEDHQCMKNLDTDTVISAAIGAMRGSSFD